MSVYTNNSNIPNYIVFGNNVVTCIGLYDSAHELCGSGCNGFMRDDSTVMSSVWLN